MKNFLILFFAIVILFFCQCREGVNKDPVIISGIISPGEIETHETFYIKFIWMGGG
jgi:hypothetical protein